MLQWCINSLHYISMYNAQIRFKKINFISYPIHHVNAVMARLKAGRIVLTRELRVGAMKFVFCQLLCSIGQTPRQTCLKTRMREL